MSVQPPRGIAVVDAGATNTKVMLFSAHGEPVAERKVASRHVEGPPYRHIDPEPMVAICRSALPELDQILPIDAVVPCAHGAALATLAADGSLAMPVVDYTAEPPPEIVEGYRKIQPPFSEVFCPLLPMAITHALQLYWQQMAFPQGFGKIATVIPYIQYVGFRLSGKAVTEITSMSCQTQLLNIAEGGFSSLVHARGWEKLFPPMVKAWDDIGGLLPEFRGDSFRGRGRVLGGIHDSTANYVRYLASGLHQFTLLSTGTWSISFDTSTTVGQLQEERDTSTNTDIFGRQVATSRFFGGREFELLAGDAAMVKPRLDDVRRLVSRVTMALPSFSGSSGPVPGTGAKGRIVGEPYRSPEERAALAALYCALMVSEQLDAVSSKHDIIVDGPFAQNEVFLRVLAALQPGQRVLASDLRDGTAAGAACLALMPDGRLPRVALKVTAVTAAEIEGLEAYRELWRTRAYANTG